MEERCSALRFITKCRLVTLFKLFFLLFVWKWVQSSPRLSSSHAPTTSTLWWCLIPLNARWASSWPQHPAPLRIQIRCLNDVPLRWSHLHSLFPAALTMAEWSMLALSVHLLWCIVENVKIIYGHRPTTQVDRLLGTGTRGNETGWKSKGSAAAVSSQTELWPRSYTPKPARHRTGLRIKPIHPSVWTQLAFHKYNWFIKQQLIKRVCASLIRLTPAGLERSVRSCQLRHEDRPSTPRSSNLSLFMICSNSRQTWPFKCYICFNKPKTTVECDMYQQMCFSPTIDG